MLIKRVHLVNFRRHRDFTIGFKEGINAILGRMGAGKSSILNAISFALFGLKDIDRENLIRRGSERAMVEVELEHGGDVFLIRREIGKSSDAILRKNGKVVEVGAEAVRRYVEQELIDYATFSQVVYVKQNQLDEIFRVSPARRKELFDRLLNIEKFERLREISVRVYNQLNRLLKEIKPDEVRAELEDLVRRLKTLKEQAAALADDIRDLAQKRAALTEKLRGLNARLAELRRQKQAVERAKEQLHRYNERKAYLQRRLMELADVKQPAELPAAEAELRRLRERLGSLRQAWRHYEERTKQRREWAARLKELTEGRPLQAWQAELEKTRAALQQSREERGKLMAQRTQYERVLSLLAQDSAQCPLCGRPLTPEHLQRLRAEHRQKIGAVAEQLQALARSIAESQQRIPQLESRIKRIAELHALLQEPPPERPPAAEELEKSAAEAEARVRRLREQQKQWEQKHRFEEELNALGAPPKIPPFSEEEYERVLAQLSSVQEQSRQLAALIHEKEQRHAELQRVMEETERRRRELQDRLDLYERRRSLLKAFAMLKEGLPIIQARFRQEFLSQINRILQSVWPLIYPYEEFKTARVRIDEKGDYRFELLWNSQWISHHTLSGGERVCLGLALRFAISYVLAPNIGLLILDEPTHNLDADAKERLASVLSEKLPVLVRQILVVTHDEDILHPTMNIIQLSQSVKLEDET